MKLQDFRTDYYTSSGKASDIARTLALSAIAIVWIFKNDGPLPGQIALPKALLLGALGAIITLSLDLLQYVWSSLIFGAWSRHKERKGIPLDQEIRVPPWFNWPTVSFYWLKLIAIAGTYYILLSCLAERIRAV